VVVTRGGESAVFVIRDRIRTKPVAAFKSRKTSTEGTFHVSGILETSKCEARHQARVNGRESESALEDLQ